MVLQGGFCKRKVFKTGVYGDKISLKKIQSETVGKVKLES